jgi:hypothetical protein
MKRYGQLVQYHASRNSEITAVTDGITDIGAYLFNAAAFRRSLLREALAAGNRDVDGYFICAVCAWRDLEITVHGCLPVWRANGNIRCVTFFNRMFNTL